MPMSRETARSERAAMYAKWLRDDADGLAHNIQGTGQAPDDEIQVLQQAKAELAEAMKIIDGAIFANRLTERSAA